jgi:hypothetical protein
MLGDVLAGIFVITLVAVAGKLNANRVWAIPILCILPLAAGMAGFREPLAKRVWIHPLVITLPGLAVVSAGAVTCRGFECGAMVGILAAAIVFMFILVGLSFAVYFIRRWVVRSDGT